MSIDEVKALVCNNYSKLFIKFLIDENLFNKFVINLKKKLDKRTPEKISDSIKWMLINEENYIMNSFGWAEDDNPQIWIEANEKWIRSIILRK